MIGELLTPGALLSLPPPDRPFDVTVFGGSLVEQIVQVPELPRPQQANVALAEMHILPGGSGANVAVYSARLGLTTRLLDKWGDDEYADLLQEGLQVEGVDLAFCRRLPGVPSAFMIILTLPDGDWSGILRLPSDLSLLAEDVSEENVRSSRILHFHGFCMGSPHDQAGVEKAIRLARKSGTLVSMDASTPLAIKQPGILRRFFGRSDIVFANEIEARAITQADGVEAIATKLLELGPTVAVIKSGASGCHLATAGTIEHIPAYRVDVTDTIGAGDGMVAGTLYGLCRERSLREAVQFGAATAALVCRGMGAQSHRFGIEDVLTLTGDIGAQ